MKYFDIAFGQYGTKEIVGPLHNEEVVEYFEVAGHSWVKDDETAWCAAFVGYCLEKAGIASTRKLNARSYLDFGIPTTDPEPGDIVVFWRGSQSSWQGHVGFFIRAEGGNIWVLGGNQSNAVNITAYKANQLLGYRKVPGVEKPETCVDSNTETLALKAENNLLKSQIKIFRGFIIKLFNK